MKIGIRDRRTEPLQADDIAVIELARIQSIKAFGVERLPYDCEVYYCVPVLGVALPEEYAEFVRPHIDLAHKAGVRNFTLHRYPNIDKFGYLVGWDSGAEFAEWWCTVRDLLASDFHDAKWGFPAMEPGERIGAVREDAEIFFRESIEAVSLADYYEIAWYWKSLYEMYVGLWRTDSYILRWPDKSLVVEFCNSNATTSKEDKAGQYLYFYEQLGDRGNVLSAFAHCVSSPDAKDKYITWRGESGTPNIIPKIVGERTF